jgi:hypothetical protein
MVVLRLSVEATQVADGQEIINVLHYNFDSTFSGPFPLSQWIDLAFHVDVWPFFVAALGGGWNYQRTVGTIIAGTDAGIQAISTLDANTTGTLAGAAATIQNAICLIKSSGFTERSANGRLFLSPRLNSDFDENGRVTGNPLGSIASLCTALALTSTWGLFVGTPGIWSEKYHGFTPINSVRQSNVCAVRRSRRIGVGR